MHALLGFLPYISPRLPIGKSLISNHVSFMMDAWWWWVYSRWVYSVIVFHNVFDLWNYRAHGYEWAIGLARLLMQDFYCPGSKHSFQKSCHSPAYNEDRYATMHLGKRRPDLFSLHILAVACCPAGIALRQLRGGNDWFDCIRHGEDTAPGCCMLGRRAEQCSVTRSPNGLGCSNSFPPCSQIEKRGSPRISGGILSHRDNTFD